MQGEQTETQRQSQRSGGEQGGDKGEGSTTGILGRKIADRCFRALASVLRLEDEDSFCNSK